jgi:hypothetical protein
MIIKGQYHEDFKTFEGKSLESLGIEADKFLNSNSLAAKSIAVLANTGGYVLSIGYRSDEPGYPVTVEDHVLADTTDINAAITDTIKSSVEGDVICHSLYSLGGTVHVVFLVHG